MNAAMQERTARPGPVFRSGSAGIGIAGPRQRKLVQLAAMLNRAPSVQRTRNAARSLDGDAGAVVQRRITLAAGGAGFTHAGRAGQHNTAANRDALIELREDRRANPNDATRHANNESEQLVATASAAAAAGAARIAASGAAVAAQALQMAHYVSDAEVQQAVVDAANAHNAGTPAAAAWARVSAMVAGIDPPAGGPAAGLAAFMAAANTASNQAQGDLITFLGLANIPVNAASATDLTSLANAIINSPMNLHHGDASTNMSLQGHGDPNSYTSALATPPALGRRSTWRTDQMRAAMIAGGFNVNDRTLNQAGAMGVGTVGTNQATAFLAANPGAAPNAALFVHSSGTPARFTIPN